jgi:YHS domain-containing protein
MPTHRATTLVAPATLALVFGLLVPATLGAAPAQDAAPPTKDAAAPKDAEAAKPPAPADDTPSDLRRTSFNVDENGLALQGYDPISYFDKAGPKAGVARFSSVYRGITYRFVSAENKAKFEADPAKWEPPYGGWCAWAVIDGDKVEIDPANFEIVDGRVYLFYKGWLGNAKKKWDAKVAAETAPKTVSAADSGWKKLAAADRAAYDAEKKAKK